jgi:acyl carrier protein
VSGLNDNLHKGDFLDGSGDIPLSELHIDSLALMEIGIGLEDDYGVSLSPNEIVRLTTISALWSRVLSG